MLCCGRKKDNRVLSNQRIIGESNNLGTKYLTHPGYQQACYTEPSPNMPTMKRSVHFPSNYTYFSDGSRPPEMIVQGDFRKVSGITSEMFRQIEACERDYIDPITAAHIETVEKRGEMMIRILDPRTLGRAGAEVWKKYLPTTMDGSASVQFVEIVKRPGQTLGLYIREGDGFRTADGVFISRIAVESPVYNSGLLRVGDEVLAVNLVDVRRMSLDDVVIIMSIPRRLVLTIRTHNYQMGIPDAILSNQRVYRDEQRGPPVVIVKKEFPDELEAGDQDDLLNRDPENGHLMRARLKGLTGSSGDGIYTESPYGYSRRLVAQEQQARQRAQEQDVAWRNKTSGYGAILPPTPNQSMSLQRLTRTPDSLSGGLSQVYPSGVGGYGGGVDSPYSSLKRDLSVVSELSRRPASSLARSLLDRGASPSRLRFLDDYGSSLTRRFNRLSRTESDMCINPFSRDYVSGNFISRPPSRTGLRSLPGDFHSPALTPLQNRRIEDLRASLSNQHFSPLMGHRMATDGSVSDTEVGGGGSSYHMRRKIPSSRLHRLHRTESDNSLNPFSQDYMNDLYISSRPASRTFAGRLMTSNVLQVEDLLSPSSFHQPRRRHDDLRSLTLTAGLPSILRTRRLTSDGSVSDTEVGGHSSPSLHYRNRVISKYVGSWRDPRDPRDIVSGYRSWKSNSLPRQTSSLVNQRLPRSIPRRSTPTRAQNQPTVRFERNSAFNSGYDYDSDGAASAPELPETRSKKLIGDPDWLKLSSRRGITSTTSDHNPISAPDSLIGERIGSAASTPVVGNINERDDDESHIKGVGLDGTLWINIIAGHGFRSSTSVPSTTRDLYCVIECDNVFKARTAVRGGDSDFEWDEIFELDLVETKIISFTLYKWDPQYRHKLCYRGSIKLLSLSIKDPTVHSLNVKMVPKGHLSIKLRYKDISISFQRIAVSPNPSNPTPLFGSPLETVVNRENSGLSVPLIVKKCTAEIEARGIDLVGIYRLCASSVRKKILREEFEKDPVSVDLSAENVPDINVVSSLLKDYIRELPEPLFTKALFDMMVDGLGVCLLDDAPGKAKLMFSILECLPKINRSTVLYLMDHIKFVESHHKRNKMNAHNLAISFGPIFTCHSESNSFQKPIEVFKNLIDVWPLNTPAERKRSDSLK
ncbi:rho GTPase activating protein at 100F isoform X2 [Brevipalpus obovatus]|uniref:rho GTPase activating protein at 100F isoform X2 n=1 Tax=Brevipalpus obovatus TaxID=246614 RepID=UPI003D9F8FE3